MKREPRSRSAGHTPLSNAGSSELDSLDAARAIALPAPRLASQTGPPGVCPDGGLGGEAKARTITACGCLLWGVLARPARSVAGLALSVPGCPTATHCLTQLAFMFGRQVSAQPLPFPTRKVKPLARCGCSALPSTVAIKHRFPNPCRANWKELAKGVCEQAPCAGKKLAQPMLLNRSASRHWAACFLLKLPVQGAR